MNPEHEKLLDRIVEIMREQQAADARFDAEQRKLRERFCADADGRRRKLRIAANKMRKAKIITGETWDDIEWAAVRAAFPSCGYLAGFRSKDYSRTWRDAAPEVTS